MAQGEAEELDDRGRPVAAPRAGLRWSVVVRSRPGAGCCCADRRCLRGVDVMVEGKGFVWNGVTASRICTPASGLAVKSLQTLEALAEILRAMRVFISPGPGRMRSGCVSGRCAT